MSNPRKSSRSLNKEGASFFVSRGGNSLGSSLDQLKSPTPKQQELLSSHVQAKSKLLKDLLKEPGPDLAKITAWAENQLNIALKKQKKIDRYFKDKSKDEKVTAPQVFSSKAIKEVLLELIAMGKGFVSKPSEYNADRVKDAIFSILYKHEADFAQKAPPAEKPGPAPRG